ncbi:MAG: MFS transporter [Candidatus Zixiibacteriota bacterium]|nr:MAG: MFS transporter [candidate division Zixibacteria bacterium]
MALSPKSDAGAVKLPGEVKALGFVSLFNDAASEMIYPLIPAFLTTVLGVGAVSLGALEGFAEALASILKVWSGRWSDKFRKRKAPTVAGYALSGLARPLMAATTVFGQLFALRLLDRVGKGIRSAPRDAMIADIVPPAIRGRAYGYQRALDHLGAVIGPLLASGLLLLMPAQMPRDQQLRWVFALAALPVVGALAVLIFGVRERAVAMKSVVKLKAALKAHFWKYLLCVFVFTLGNSSDAFLLLRAQDLGVSLALIPILWSAFHIVKSVTATPGGRLSDRFGRFTILALGWGWYALVYVGFAFAGTAWHVWALFLVYGVYFGLAEGVERAFVVDLVGDENRGYAFGWFHLAVGIAALPASLIFGLIWTAFSPQAAFLTGAGLAGVAVILLTLLVHRPARA